MDVERGAFAWEWLRRSESYRRSALPALLRRDPLFRHGLIREDPLAARWGLHAFEDPLLPADRARPVWRAQALRHILFASARAAPPGTDAFDLEQVQRFATLVLSADGREHLLLSDGARSIRVDVVGGSLCGAPGRLEYHIAGIEAAEAPLNVLRRFLTFWRRRAFPRALFPREKRAASWILLLRAYDAIGSGATQREIAAALLSKEAELPRWRLEAPTLRSRVQRLVRAANQMATGAWRQQLR